MYRYCVFQFSHLVKLVQSCVHPSTQHSDLFLLLCIDRLVAPDEVQEGFWCDVGAPTEPAVVRDARLAHALLDRRHRVVEVNLCNMDGTMVVKDTFTANICDVGANMQSNKIFLFQLTFAEASHWILKLVRKWLATATSASFGHG